MSRAGATERPGAFNRAVPVLAVMLNYAEQLGYRRKTTNPCKGIARYKRVLPERFLSPGEYHGLDRPPDDGEGCRRRAGHGDERAQLRCDLTWPESVSARGLRRFRRGDDWEMYDTMALDLNYAGGRTIRWDGHSCNAVQRYGRGRGVLLLGTKGSAVVDRNGYELFDLAGKSLRVVTAAATSETTGTVGEGVLDVYHAGNFVDVIRGRANALASPMAEGHISTTLCHLGNIAWRTGSVLTIDPATGKPASDEAMKLWSVDYEPGWEV